MQCSLYRSTNGKRNYCHRKSEYVSVHRMKDGKKRVLTLKEKIHLKLYDEISNILVKITHGI